MAQRDRIPLGGDAPTGGWLSGEWIDDPQPPFDLPPGQYAIAVGLYDADSGRRLIAPNGQDRHLVGALVAGQ